MHSLKIHFFAPKGPRLRNNCGMGKEKKSDTTLDANHAEYIKTVDKKAHSFLWREKTYKGRKKTDTVPTHRDAF